MSTPSFVPPWDPNFTNTINAAIVTAENTAAAVIPDVISQLPPITDVLSQLPPIIPIPTPPPAPVPGPVSIPGGNITNIETAVKEALASLMPQLQADALAYVQQVLTGNPIPNVTYNGESLTKTAAKGHAWRTFLIGMGTSAASAILSAVGSQAHLDFFTKEGWIATGTIAVATLIQTAISYLGRLQITPDFERALAAAPPTHLK